MKNSWRPARFFELERAEQILPLYFRGLRPGIGKLNAAGPPGMHELQSLQGSQWLIAHESWAKLAAELAIATRVGLPYSQG